MEERKDHGLRLKVSISDSGTGLNAGIPEAFPDICVQPDIFHELRPVGAELAWLERKAEKLTADEAALERRASGKHPQKKTLERLSLIHEKVDMAIQEYDLMRILFCWLVELTGFSGYPFQDACLLAEWVLSEMDVSFPDSTKLLGQTRKIRERLPQIMSFLQRMEESFAAASRKKRNSAGNLPHHVPAESFPYIFLGMQPNWNTVLANSLETAMNQRDRNSTAY